MAEFDPGREHDLYLLDAKLKDPTVSKARKKRLFATKQTLLKQMQNKPLIALRNRMLRAQQAGDGLEASKLAKQLEEYDYKYGILH